MMLIRDTVKNEGWAYAHPFLRRLQNPVTGEYLHLSGYGTTPHEDYAWCGVASQARALRKQAEKDGEPFPYRMVKRDQGNSLYAQVGQMVQPFQDMEDAR